MTEKNMKTLTIRGTTYEIVDEKSRTNTPDWNQNDPTSMTYVQNRPFYTTDPVETELVNGTFTFENMGGIYGTMISELPSDISLNSEMRIVFDNIQYNTAFKVSMDIVYAGNGALINDFYGTDLFNDTGEPFVILYAAPNEVMIAANNTETEHIISITLIDITHIQLPEKYISYKPGKKTEGTVYTTEDGEVTAGIGAEIFNNEINKAIGPMSHAEGTGTKASGNGSHAEGQETTAYGGYGSHAEGYCTISHGWSSHAEGGYFNAIGNHLSPITITSEQLPYFSKELEILGPIAYGTQSHAEGAQTFAYGDSSHAEGWGTIARGNSSHAEGRFNKADDYYLHVVGNGKSNEQRSNAYTLDYDGNAWYAGDVYVGGTSQNDGAKLITEAKVDEKISKINIPEQDLSNYALKSEIPSIAGLATEAYADSAATQVKNDLLNGAGAAYDTLKELGDLIDVNVDAIEALETVASGKADKVHTHDQYLTEHQDISGKADKSELFSKSYNDLTNKPTLGSLAAKNTVVKSDLDSSIQTSLNKADTALQSFTETDPTVPAWAKEATKPTYTANEIGAEPAGAANNALEAAKAYAAEKTHTHYVKDITDFKATMNQYATNIYVDSQIANMASGLGGIPQYVHKGADMVANKVIASRNHASLVIGAMTDLHTSGEDDSATSVKHACFAMNEINKNTQLDLVAVLGDVMVDHMDSVNNPGFKYVKQQLDPIVKAVPFVQLEGNHDLDEVNTSADVRRQEYYAYIGANNVDVVTDFGNEFRNYGYKDFNNKRIRVVYLNTSDVAEEGMTTHLRISDEQFNWFINTALNFSNKEGASDWQVVVLTHIPLNYTNKYLQALLQLLKDYKDKRNGSISPSGTTISYDFRNNAQTFLCHIHGHIHNFRTEWFDNVLSITVPNACFGRNNEYGTSSSYDDTVHELYGDVDKDGNQRVYAKTMATVEDTAFSVFVIDGRINNKVHVYNYGAGIHRIIDLVDKSIIEEEINHYEGEGLTPNGDFVNAIPTSTTIGSTAVYNGKGYKNDTYVSSSGGVDSSSVGYVATGVMDYPVNDVYAHEFYILGADLDVTDSKVRIGLFTADGTVRAVLSGESAITGKFKVTQLGDQYYKVEPLYNTSGTPMIYASYGSGDGQTITGMRLSLKGIGQNLFVSMKNPIVAGLDGETVNWSAYTNVVPSSIDTEGEVFNGVGYKEGTRLNSSGAEASLARAICSGFIPYNNEDIRAYGARVENLEAGAFYVCFYNAAFEKIGVIPGREFSGSNPGLTSEMVDEKMMLTIDVSEVTNETFKGYMNDATYMRVSMSSCSGQVFVVTLNEKLILD